MVLAFVFWDFSVSGRGCRPGWRWSWCSSWSRPAIGWFIAAVRGPRPRRRAGQRLAGRHRRPARRLHRRRAADLAARAAHRPAVLPRARRFSVGDAYDHRPPADHDRRLGPGRGRPLPAAHPHPDRHRDAGLGRQPRAAPALRRQARPGRRAVLGDRHLAGRRSAASCSSPVVGLDYFDADPAGHQRVRRRDARPAQEPAADLRRRDGAGPAAVLRRRLPARSTGCSRQVENVVPALFLFVVIVAMPQAQLRIGQVKGIVSAPLPSLPRTLGLGRRRCCSSSRCSPARCPTPTCCWSAPRRRSRS